MARRYGTIVNHLTTDPDTAVELASRLDDDVLVHLSAAIDDEIRRRAIDGGDFDALIASGFDAGFGRDQLATLPWIEGGLIVCPGAIVNKGKNRSSHRCRFVSVNDVWIWDSAQLLREDKQSNPGTDEGFRAVGLLPIMDGMELDMVSGRARSGQHSVERVVSFVVKRGELVEVSQRDLTAKRH